jgi:hypothetical protein
MDDFSILALTEMDMPPEIEELNIKYKITPQLSDEIISVLRDMRSNISNMLIIMEHY